MFQRVIPLTCLMISLTITSYCSLTVYASDVKSDLLQNEIKEPEWEDIEEPTGGEFDGMQEPEDAVMAKILELPEGWGEPEWENCEVLNMHYGSWTRPIHSTVSESVIRSILSQGKDLVINCWDYTPRQILLVEDSMSEDEQQLYDEALSYVDGLYPIEFFKTVETLPVLRQKIVIRQEALNSLRGGDLSLASGFIGFDVNRNAMLIKTDNDFWPCALELYINVEGYLIEDNFDIISVDCSGPARSWDAGYHSQTPSKLKRVGEKIDSGMIQVNIQPEDYSDILVYGRLIDRVPNFLSFL